MRRKRKYWLILTLSALIFLSVLYISANFKVFYVVQYSSKNVYDSTNANPDDAASSNLLADLAGQIDDSPRFTNNDGQLKTSDDCEKDRRNVEIQCEPLDIAVVCAGYAAVRRLIPLLKSLLFYRTSPVHFHLITDGPVTRHILSTLFDTWHIPGVTQSFYDARTVVNDVSWIPNKHYSGIYGLLKLTLPKILPANLEKVLVLDNDVIFTSDVVELWRFWKYFNNNQLIGLVENQSHWYLGTLFKNYKPWPAIGNGFNTGVILMNLTRMRSLNWMEFWTNLTNTTLPTHGSLGLADQDVFNVVIKENPHFVYKLPCEWNLQLGKNSLVDLCTSSVADLKIIHWNSPQKLNIKGKYARFFRQQYQAFSELDQILFRRELFRCHNISIESTDDRANSEDADEDDVCIDFRRAQQISHRIHLFYVDFDYQPKSGDVTLVTQSSFDRLQMLEQLLFHWEGPASIALYLSDSEADQFLNFVQDSSNLSTRKNVGFHIVYRQGDFYPINKLRNVALNQVLTPYVFLADVDFLPMFGLYDVLCQTLAIQESSDKKAYIVPAFETQRYKFTFPRSKSELLNMLDTGQISMFRQEVWSKGHHATNYDRWRIATTPYAVSWSSDYEPYIVVNRSSIPPYDERFAGFGWNKVAHIMELDAAGYDFLVLPNAFAVHLPHAPSFEIVKFRSNPNYRRCLKLLKGQFIKELIKRYSPDRVKQNNPDTV